MLDRPRYQDTLITLGILLAGCRSNSDSMLWRRSLDSVGAVPYSGVGLCVGADVVFIAAASHYSPGIQPPPGRIVALRYSDGSPKWTAVVGEANLSTPILTRRLLIVADLRDRLYALEATSGQTAWQRELASYGRLMGVNQQEIVAKNGRLYVRCPNASAQEMRLVCLTEDSGSTVWETRLRWSWAQIAVALDDVVYIGSQNFLSSIDPRNGKVMKSTRLSAQPFVGLSCVGNDVVYATANTLVRLEGRTLREQWHTALKGSMAATKIHKPSFRCERVVSVSDNRVCVWLGNQMWAVDGSSGRLVWQREWQHDLDPCLTFLDGEMIVVGYVTDELAQVEILATSNGSTIHRLALTDMRFGYRTLAIANGRFYILTTKEVRCQQL